MSGVVDREVDTVEADEALIGAQPKVVWIVAILTKGLDAVGVVFMFKGLIVVAGGEATIIGIKTVKATAPCADPKNTGVW